MEFLITSSCDEDRNAMWLKAWKRLVSYHSQRWIYLMFQLFQILFKGKQVELLDFLYLTAQNLAKYISSMFKQTNTFALIVNECKHISELFLKAKLRDESVSVGWRRRLSCGKKFCQNRVCLWAAIFSRACLSNRVGSLFSKVLLIWN